MLAPKGLNVSFRIRWTDQDTRRVRVQNLAPADARTQDTREAAAMRQWRASRKRKDEIRDGDSPHHERDMSISDAIAKYFEHGKQNKAYLIAAESFKQWAAKQRVHTVAHLSKGKLRGYALATAAAPKMIPLQGGKRGEFVESDGKRSQHAINRELRAMSAILNELRSQDVIRLSNDDIADALKRGDADIKKRPFLRPLQIKKLLEACAKYDQLTYKLDRKGRRDTPRHKPIRRFVEFLLFSGVRIEEVGGLLPSDVSERELWIRSDVAKQGIERVVQLGISTTLLAMAPDLQKRTTALWDLTEDELKRARERLIKLGAPHFTWRSLRNTAATYLVCSSVLGHGPSLYLAAAQLGHSPDTLHRWYAGVIQISGEAKTLEAAMGL